MSFSIVKRWYLFLIISIGVEANGFVYLDNNLYSSTGEIIGSNSLS